MLEIGPRSWTERGLTNRIDQVIELFKLRLVNPLSVQDLGPISSIVDTGPKARIRLEIKGQFHQRRLS